MELTKEQPIQKESDHLVVSRNRLKEVFGNDLNEAKILFGYMKEVKAGKATITPEKDDTGRMGGVSIKDETGKQLYFNGNPNAKESLEEFYDEFSMRELSKTDTNQ